MADAKKYPPTGRWEVVSEYDSNSERNFHVLVDPHGVANSQFVADLVAIAHAYADTYNENEDKAEEFRTCPYCDSQCPWCT
jgi:hypothetical protein